MAAILWVAVLALVMVIQIAADTERVLRAIELAMNKRVLWRAENRRQRVVATGRGLAERRAGHRVGDGPIIGGQPVQHMPP